MLLVLLSLACLTIRISGALQVNGDGVARDLGLHQRGLQYTCQRHDGASERAGQFVGGCCLVHPSSLDILGAGIYRTNLQA
ncbi:hypothetical protein ACWA7J_12215 [Leptothrix sp. BB-4]